MGARKPQAEAIALPTAEVFSLCDWRKERAKPAPELKPLYPVTDRPGMDFNEMGHGLRYAAQLMRMGQLTQTRASEMLDGLSANAMAACRVGHDLEIQIIRAHRLLSPIFDGKEGDALERAIAKAAKPKARKKFAAKYGKGGK